MWCLVHQEWNGTGQLKFRVVAGFCSISRCWKSRMARAKLCINGNHQLLYLGSRLRSYHRLLPSLVFTLANNSVTHLRPSWGKNHFGAPKPLHRFNLFSYLFALPQFSCSLFLTTIQGVEKWCRMCVILDFSQWDNIWTHWVRRL